MKKNEEDKKGKDHKRGGYKVRDKNERRKKKDEEDKERIRYKMKKIKRRKRGIRKTRIAKVRKREGMRER